MVEPRVAQRWSYRILFVIAVTVIVFVQLLPFGLGEGRFPGPDVLTILIFAWVLRRSDYVPAPLIAGVAVVADILFMRPPGLWAALTVLGSETLRTRSQGGRDVPFVMEWGLVLVTLLLMTLANAAILAVTVEDGVALSAQLARALTGAAAYPLVVAVTLWPLGVRRVGPGRTETQGSRI